VIGTDGKQLGILSLADAINMARANGVDLVEIAAAATPPVCRLVDYGKYRYEQSKRDKEAKKHQHANKVKEIQLSPSIDPHDFGVKLNHAIEAGQWLAGEALPSERRETPMMSPEDEQKVEIGQDGTISIRALGEAPSVMAEVDRLKLVNPDLRQMEKGSDGLIRTKDRQPLEPDANVRVTSGFLEASNVNAVEEMTAILSLSRQFELQIKMMRTAEENSSAVARVLQLS